MTVVTVTLVTVVTVVGTVTVVVTVIVLVVVTATVVVTVVKVVTSTVNVPTTEFPSLANYCISHSQHFPILFDLLMMVITVNNIGNCWGIPHIDNSKLMSNIQFPTSLILISPHFLQSEIRMHFPIWIVIIGEFISVFGMITIKVHQFGARWVKNHFYVRALSILWKFCTICQDF